MTAGTTTPCGTSGGGARPRPNPAPRRGAVGADTTERTGDCNFGSAHLSHFTKVRGIWGASADTVDV